MWRKIMRFGRMMGCHQMPERSFFIRGRQLPICARCTGVFLGQTFSVVLFWVYEPPLFMCLLFCLLMFIDWLLQYKKIMESTNVRRMITGTLCGYGMMSMEMAVVVKIFKCIIHFNG